MIEVHDLTKVYGSKHAVHGVSFRVEKGEILGFLGPNGAGKTTTMRILAGYVPATSGSAQVDGFDVFDRSLEVRRRIGYMPENPPLYLDMTVQSFLAFAARIKGVPRRRVRERIERVCDQCGLSDVRGRLIGNLSKGYRQRVGLAQALVHDPPVLILDEPTVGLDPRQILEIRELIRTLGGDRTVLLSTHILPEVTMTCRRVVIINRGKVAADDTVEGLESSMRRSDRLRLDLARPGGDAERVLSALTGVTRVRRAPDGTFEIEASPGRDVREELSRLCVDRGWGLLGLSRSGLSLEEIFIHIVTDEEAGIPASGGGDAHA